MSIQAASTHSGEEKVILTAHSLLTSRWKHVKGPNDPPPLLILAPRHPQRCKTIVKMAGDEVVLRSSQDHPRRSTRIFIVDTIGTLRERIEVPDLPFEA